MIAFPLRHHSTNERDEFQPEFWESMTQCPWLLLLPCWTSMATLDEHAMADFEAGMRPCPRLVIWVKQNSCSHGGHSHSLNVDLVWRGHTLFGTSPCAPLKGRYGQWEGSLNLSSSNFPLDVLIPTFSCCEKNHWSFQTDSSAVEYVAVFCKNSDFLLWLRWNDHLWNLQEPWQRLHRWNRGTFQWPQWWRWKWAQLSCGSG